MTPIMQAAAVAVLAIGTGAATVTVMKDDVADFAVPDKSWKPGRELDGMVIATRDTVLETGEVLEDEVHFVDGRFQSKMCQVYCDFGWAEYQTSVEGEVIHFTATTTCPDAPHTVVWYGTLVGDTLNFEGTWTTRRWYWTRQLNLIGGGTVMASSEGAAG